MALLLADSELPRPTPGPYVSKGDPWSGSQCPDDEVQLLSFPMRRWFAEDGRLFCCGF